MTRAFVAVALPSGVLDAVASRLGELELGGERRTTRDQWHLTLQFLGDADIDAVVSALDGFSVPGGRVRLGGAGAFPKERRASVLWLGVVDGHDVLAALAGAVGQCLAPLGYEPESRPFRPHVTLVRCAKPTDLRTSVAALGAEPVGPGWNVDSLVLYESQLRREGARYVERATVALPD